MGLNTTHGAWSGPCKFFNAFRRALGHRIDVELHDYVGYNEGGTKAIDDIDHPLRYLFNMSDSEGEMTPSECCLVAYGIDQVMSGIRLDDLQNNVIVDLKFNYTMQDFWQDCENFKNGCVLAVKKGEPLIFQ